MERHPNPTIAAIDDGHIERTVSDRRPGMSKLAQQAADELLHHCKADGEPWPCQAMQQAVVAARARADQLAVEAQRERMRR